MLANVPAQISTIILTQIDTIKKCTQLAQNNIKEACIHYMTHVQFRLLFKKQEYY